MAATATEGAPTAYAGDTTTMAASPATASAALATPARQLAWTPIRSLTYSAGGAPSNRANPRGFRTRPNRRGRAGPSTGAAYGATRRPRPGRAAPPGTRGAQG